MKAITLVGSLLLLFQFSSFGQTDYTLQFEKEGLEVYTKIGKARVDGAKRSVLLLKIDNASDSAYTFTIGVDFFLHGKREEAMQTESMCIEAGKILQGKLNGMYFISETLTEEQFLSNAFEYEIELEVAAKSVSCEE